MFILVHPCDKATKGGCDQVCEKDGAKAVCKCDKEGFQLEEDNQSCEFGKFDKEYDRKKLK